MSRPGLISLRTLLLACLTALTVVSTPGCSDSKDLPIPKPDAGSDGAAGAGGGPGSGGSPASGGVGGGPGAGGTGGGADAAATGDADAAEDVGGDGPDAADASTDGGSEAGTQGGVVKLDLLFVVDNSNSMMQEQANLKASFPGFLKALDLLPGGRPDLHVGVVSSNFGAGPTQPAAECPPGGDRGVLQVLPECGLDPAVRFLSVDALGKANFTGSLADRFACVATLGIKGCGYEHQLQSMRAALDQRTSENAGFLRPDAYLGIVILSDEDDCSGEPTANFFADPIAGQSGSFRCAQLGHVCNGVSVPAQPFTAPLDHCMPYVRQPGETNSRLINVGDFISFVTALKGGNQNKLVVSTIIGWSADSQATYAIKQINTSRGLEVDLAPICENPATGSAAPGLRLAAFARGFVNHTVDAICTPDLSSVMAKVSGMLSGLVSAAR
jgi:hypothetical protein